MKFCPKLDLPKSIVIKSIPEHENVRLGVVNHVVDPSDALVDAEVPPLRLGHLKPTFWLFKYNFTVRVTRSQSYTRSRVIMPAL
jgi:hypothetical protein